MSAETFRRQMEIIRQKAFPVISLDTAGQFLHGGPAPSASVVITIDDGWYGTYCDAVPILSAFEFPATIYVTTYYADKRLPVFNLLVQYLFWRSPEQTIDLADLGNGLEGTCDLTDPDRREAAMDAIIAKDAELGPVDRQDLADRLARVLDVDIENIRSRRMLELMTLEEVRSAAGVPGMDIQLHTHRHGLGLMGRDEVQTEIGDNRSVLEPPVGKKLVHFCYPSGEYEPHVWPVLRDLGIETATTTESGLVSRRSEPMALKRICIGDRTPDIQFEAELCGVMEILRCFRSGLKFGSDTRRPVTGQTGGRLEEA